MMLGGYILLGREENNFGIASPAGKSQYEEVICFSVLFWWEAIT
jgi:hypothetical protein